MRPPAQIQNSIMPSATVRGKAVDVSGFRTQGGENDRRRIVLYSHDTMGLGHKRRNLLIARTLGSAELGVDILLISGMGEANAAALPAGVDLLTLPSLGKTAAGQYQSRRLTMSLQEMVRLRSQLILTAVKQFQPDALIVDNVPRGALRELDPTLEFLRCCGTTRCILGLRDVLDAPAAVYSDWQRADSYKAVRRYYDRVWIYGDPALYDLRCEYRFAADITAKMQPLGYLNPRTCLPQVSVAAQAQMDHLGLHGLGEANSPDRRDIIFCQVGGGQDGAALAAAFAQAVFPPDSVGVLLTGPFMPEAARQRLQALAAANPRLRLFDYLAEPTLLLAQASRVVAMGGYNTTCEILAYQKPALVVPRISPRQEQWLRADRLCRRGLIDMMQPDQLTAQSLTNWLMQPVLQRSPANVNLNGLDNLVVDLQRQLATVPLPDSQAS